LAVANRVVFAGPWAANVSKLRQGDLRDRLFCFETVYEASAFLTDCPQTNELIYVKSSITEHLERIVLSQTDEIVCWRDRCGKGSSCPACEEYRNPVLPGFLKDFSQ
jgi:hypothetical protein